jgi:hypothetical protein
MSILFRYDYFDTTTEDLDTLKRKLTTVEKAQQGNTAEIVAHTSNIKRLNSIGKTPYSTTLAIVRVTHQGFYKHPIFRITTEITQNS